MKVNYVLMYGIPYVRYKEFETFEDISKFLVHKGYANYSIFKKLEDKEEIEMIYRDNDIHYLENFVKEQDKEIERLNNIINKIDKLFEVDTHCEDIYYAIGVVLNKKYHNIEMISNEEILNILGSDKE